MGSVHSRVERAMNNQKWSLDVFWSIIESVLIADPEPPGLTDDLLEVLFEDDGSNYETDRLNGYVTKLRTEQSLAVINHEVYMDLAIPVPGGKKLRLGDFVVAIIKRRCPDDAWRVDRIEAVDRLASWKTSDDFDDASILELAPCLADEEQSSDGGHLKSKTIVGQVTSVEDSNVVIIDGGKVKFESNPDVTFIVGDLVATKVLFDPEEPDQKLKCVDAQPLRKWKFEGRINVLDEEAGVIDNDVYFQKSVCMNG